jgi:hypothetical protein
MVLSTLAHKALFRPLGSAAPTKYQDFVKKLLPV